MAKILNTDAFAPEARFIKIGNVEYRIAEMTVADFVEVSKLSEKMENATIVEQMTATVDMICRSVPDLPREILETMPMDRLGIITSFIRGDQFETGVESRDETTGAVEKKIVAKSPAKTPKNQKKPQSAA